MFQAAGKSALWKIKRFIRYCLALLKELRSGKYQLVVSHDYLSLLAYWVLKPLSGYKGLTWFNSYDALDLKNNPVNSHSLMNLVAKNHDKLFSQLDFFSLPAVERKQYYPCGKVKRETFVIPNFPAVSFYKPFYKPKKIEQQQVIKLIYQGALGPGHGYEEIIKILGKMVRGKSLHLILKGWIAEDYKQALTELALQCGVADKLSFESFSFYRTVPQLASTCNIGLAIFTKQDIMNKTLGTASNKIYEYAAVGLPVVLYDSSHFRVYLGNKPWAFFTDLSEESLLSTFESIVDNYQVAASSAYENFLQEFNFERVFTPALRSVTNALSA
jgi:glycosyltransferase involved in cell wall biosynthesis